MAKNYRDIYNSANDSIALEQRWYAKLETTRGQLAIPTDADFFYTLGGGSINFSQPRETSPHRTGRHNTSTIKKKKEMGWSLSTYFNINESLGAPSTAEIDPAMRMLFKSLFGAEDVTGGSPVYNTSTPPDLTFSLFEVGDKWARQGRGAFVQDATLNFPGNGESMIEWSGNGAESYLCGIAKSTADNDGGNTITLLTADAARIPVGAIIMLIEANGTTRSADTPNGSARTVTAKSTNVITVSGAVLADADGSGGSAPIYVCYYEPTTPTAINNPVTGLVGTFELNGTSFACLRSGVLKIANGHELVNYCYGADALHDRIFVPGSRVTITFAMELNLNHEVLEFFNGLTAFTASDIDLVLGSASGRRFHAVLPQVDFPVPAFSIPDTGSIPVTFEGTAQQTGLEAADEITASFV